MSNASVLQRQSGVQRRKGITRETVRRQPVGNDRLALSRTESIGHERKAGLPAERERVRMRLRRAGAFEGNSERQFGEPPFAQKSKTHHVPRRDL